MSMETDANYDENSPHFGADSRVKTSTRLNYEAQAQVIISQIGDLEQIRKSLDLSQRKMAQLLLIDPSSWSRWTQKGDAAPPHIYRALQWYMILQEKIPGLNASYFLQKDMGSLKKEIEKNISARMDQLVFNSATEIERFEGEIIDLKQKLKCSEDNQAGLVRRLKNLSRFFYGLLFLVCFALSIVFLF